MLENTLEELLNRNILTKKVNGDFTLKTPVNITITANVIERLKLIYMPDFERGGVLSGEIRGDNIYIDYFVEVPNKAVVGYSYSPSMAFFKEVYNHVLETGRLPFAIHTHPTTLGIKDYDSKRATFFQGSSKADQRIARNGVMDTLIMPEFIFVADARLDGGFSINLYTGDNRANILGGIVIALGVLRRKLLISAFGGLLIGVNYLLKTEDVTVLGNGDMKIRMLT